MRLLGILALLATHLSAETLERLSLDDMIQKSTEIVCGRVVGISTLTRGPLVYTQYRVRVTDQFKGNQSAEFLVHVPGGKAGPVVQTFAGSPRLGEGQDYMLFLWTSRSGLTQLIGSAQGLFELKQDSKNGLMVSRPVIRETMVDATGKVVEDTPVGMRLGEMVDRIRRTLAGVSR